MPVEFKNFSINDHGRPLTVENAFKFYGAFAGLHDYAFNDLYTQDDADWQSDTGLTIAHDVNEMTLSASGAWLKTRQDTPLPSDHTVYFTSSGTDYYQGVVVGALNGLTYYMVVQEGTEVWKVYKVVAGVKTLKQSTKFPYDQFGGDFTCTFRAFATGGEETDLWISITLWRNERHVLTYVEKIPEPLTGPYYVGFAAYSANDRVYSNIRVPELCIYAEYGTLDPGETPVGGLERAIEGRYLRYFLRHDAALTAFRPKTKTIDATLHEDDIRGRDVRTDLRVLKSHVRIMGAYDWGEAIDFDLINVVGHRFLEESNPMLMSEDECIIEARRHLRRLNSIAHTSELQSTNLPLIELEDRIHDDEGEWIVDGYSKSFSQGSILTSYHLRKYLPNS